MVEKSNAIPFPSGLVKAVFDNNQKVGKTYLISETNIVPTSVITSHLWITLDPESKMQENQNFKADQWMRTEVNDTIKKQILKTLSETCGNSLRNTRDSFIQSCIDKIVKQSKDVAKDIIDSLLTDRAFIDNQKRCLECGCESDITYRLCRNCGGKVMKETFSGTTPNEDEYISPYESFSEYSSKLPKITCQAGEPDFINPNGYQNIVQVIQAIGERAGIKLYGKGNREWLMVECDGLPYNLIRDIIANVWRCSKCISCFYGLSIFQEHKCYILHKIVPVYEFGWLVPISGLLHLEMNIGISFMKLNWDVFTKTLGVILGFKSPKAQEYLKKGADHHKLWHFYETLYISLSLELIVPYVRECLSTERKPTCDGYWLWCESIADPNYIYIQHSVFTYLHAMMIMRTGRY